MSCIKSVQRGIDGDVGRIINDKNIPINPVDPNKTFVMVESTGASPDADSFRAVGRLASSTILTISSCTHTDGWPRFNTWQVVEFA